MRYKVEILEPAMPSLSPLKTVEPYDDTDCEGYEILTVEPYDDTDCEGYEILTVEPYDDTDCEDEAECLIAGVEDADGNEEQAEADARLIAAAPAMLEALEEAKTAIREAADCELSKTADAYCAQALQTIHSLSTAKE